MRKFRGLKNADIGNGILSFFYPHTCPFCGKVLLKEGCCDACRTRIHYVRQPKCMRCGKPIANEQKEYCRDCEKKERSFEQGYGLWLHEGAVRQAVYQFKYRNRRVFASYFAGELLKEYEDVIRKWKISLIIPIPLSKKRRRKRGYNQAELVAAAMSENLGIPMDQTGLVRIKDTRPQNMLEPVQRSQNIRHAFVWGKREKPAENVLLIDDIYTTGNTINSAAKVLRMAGARKVYFLTISIGQGY